MSRTDAHKPYWVAHREAVETAAPTETYHYHQHFGKPVFKRVTERDLKGQPIFEEVTILGGWYALHRIQLTLPPEERYSFERLNKAYTNAGYFTIKGEDGWFKKITRPKTKTVILGYFADRCTAEEPLTRDNKTLDGFFSTCSSYLPRYRERKLYPPASRSQADKRNNTAGNRKIVSNKLKNEVKSFNGSDDFEGDGYQTFEPFHKPARQKYWD